MLQLVGLLVLSPWKGKHVFVSILMELHSDCQSFQWKKWSKICEKVEELMLMFIDIDIDVEVDVNANIETCKSTEVSSKDEVIVHMDGVFTTSFKKLCICVAGNCRQKTITCFAHIRSSARHFPDCIAQSKEKSCFSTTHDDWEINVDVFFSEVDVGFLGFFRS